MQFGLSNASTIFQHMMNDIFREYLDQFMVSYLNDILIYYLDPNTHEQHVMVLSKLVNVVSMPNTRNVHSISPRWGFSATCLS